MKYSCLVPVYNEGPRIFDVLTALTQSKKLSEIICVDDGSTDDSVEVIKKKFPKILLLEHKRNQGKTAAIQTGIRSAKYDVIVLIDSDLKNLKGSEIDQAISVFEQNNLDCLLLNTAPMGNLDRLLRSMFRFLLLAAGNRIIRKSCLEAALLAKTPEGYHLEIAQNKYLLENRKKVAYFDISAADVSKVAKNGWLKGLWGEVKMWRQIISYAGFSFFLRQTLSFARRQVG